MRQSPDAMKPASGVSRAGRALDALAFLLSDVRYGLGAYLGVYLMTEHGWDPASIGFALSFGGIVGLVMRGPLCFMVDRIRAKRVLLAVAVVIVTATCLAIPLAPRFWPVAAIGVVGALAGVTIGPALASISLGIVGPAGFARRACRNESLFHFGNGCVNVAILLLAPLFGTPVLFWAMGSTAVGSVAAALAVPEDAIDHGVARGLLPGDTRAPSIMQALGIIAGSRPLMVFALCGALFNLGNASMLGLMAQRLALANPGMGIALTAASAITAQCVMAPAAAMAGWKTDAWGRKPLLLVGFFALVLRGVLYTVVHDASWTVAVQLLDGLAAGLMGALFPVVIADLTRGAGCFNSAQGAVGMLQDVGGVCSGMLAGWIVVTAGYDAAFLTLAAIGALGGALFWLARPESGPSRAGNPRTVVGFGVAS